MNVEEYIAKFLSDHLGATLTLVALAASVKLANFLAKKWPIPPASAPWYTRWAHMLLVNWPAWESELEGEVRGLGAAKGKSFPFASITVRPPAEAVDKAREVLGEPAPEKKSSDGGYTSIGIMMCIAISTVVYVVVLLSCSGCGPEKAYVRALQVKGEASDTLIAAHVGWNAVSQIHHDNIVRDAPTLAIGLQRLDAWENGSAKKGVAALVVGRAAVQKLRKALMAVGAAKRKDWTALIIEVSTAIGTMVATLTELGVHVNWTPPTVSLPTSAVERGFRERVSRAPKCYSFFNSGGAMRFRQIGCEFFAVAGGAQ